MSGGQSGDAAFESLSPQKSLLHQTAGGTEGGGEKKKINADAQSSRKNRELTAN